MARKLICFKVALCGCLLTWLWLIDNSGKVYYYCIPWTIYKAAIIWLTFLTGLGVAVFFIFLFIIRLFNNLWTYTSTSFLKTQQKTLTIHESTHQNASNNNGQVGFLRILEFPPTRRQYECKHRCKQARFIKLYNLFCNCCTIHN